MNTGRVFNIQRYSIHDGPGIRTTFFMKGCPLNCWWCHNPESKNFNKEIIFRRDKCLGCKICIKKCSSNSLSLREEGISRNIESCLLCGACTKGCPTEAMELMGNTITISQAMSEIEKDKIFYDESKGGVTFSGGEPLSQPKFLLGLLEKCKEKGINTVIDTCGFVPWTVMEAASRLTDIFLFDIKHMDSYIHERYTGVSNELILQNLEKLALIHEDIVIRIPIIPRINDNDENIYKTGEFIRRINLRNVSILPYHNTGIDKYERLGHEYRLKDITIPSEEMMEGILSKLEGFGLNVRIGG